MCILHLLADVFELLEAFRKYFEYSDLLPHTVEGKVNTLLAALEGDLDKEELKSFRTHIIDHIKKSLEDRFPDSDILNAFRIFDPAAYKSLKSVEEVNGFGKKDMGTLLKHLAQGNRIFNLQDRAAMQQVKE